eukprot:COSAG01_NODE_30905_length_607_cov_1.633858_1_plen_105_part_10
MARIFPAWSVIAGWSVSRPPPTRSAFAVLLRRGRQCYGGTRGVVWGWGGGSPATAVAPPPPPKRGRCWAPLSTPTHRCASPPSPHPCCSQEARILVLGLDNAGKT